MTERGKNGKPLRGHRALRVGRWSDLGACYFLTFRVATEPGPLLADPRCAESVINSLVHLRKRNEIGLVAYVAMPDHVHALVVLHGEDLSAVVRRLRSFAAREIRRAIGGRGAVWARGFYDHRIRDEEDLCTHLDYIHFNPVRAGLVLAPEEWPFSTAHPSRAGEVDYDLEL
jgi:REP element-mobilizing transposase RayT